MTNITEAEDDKQYRKAMFDDALAPNYLGNPDVVGALVADYCLDVRDMLVQRASGALSAPDFIAQVNNLQEVLSIIFSGRSDVYKPIIGWNAISLGARLRVALSTYWQENRAAHGDDPIKVLFAWLCWGVFDAMQRSNDDPSMEEIYLSDRTEVAIKLLLGTDRRA